MVATGQRAGTLLSVNVGMPRDVTWHGRTVHTAVWKKPVTGPQMAGRLNIDGDGQGDLAGHGGEQRAVFVYQIESYRYWQQQLGRDDFSYGQFGENFTVRGLADDQVCIGDRYQIGGAVFEVTQPRVTCFRVGIRMDDPRMPALLVSHHRPGFYFRVLIEGAVQDGDEIIKVASGPEAMTVAETDALLYLPGHPRQQLLRALRIPALSGGWKASFQEMLDQTGQSAGDAGLTEASPPPAWPGFRPLAVTGIDQESETVISLHLADPGGGSVPAALPGQFLTLRLHPDPAGRPLLRSYSLSGPPEFMADVSAALAAGGIQAARIRTEVFGPGPAQTPGIAPAAARRPHPPAGQPGSGPLVSFARSDLNARWDPGYGIPATPASSSSPKPATCRCAGHAAPECATPARQSSSPERSATPPPRSMTPPTAAYSSAAPSHATTCSTCDHPVSHGYARQAASSAIVIHTKSAIGLLALRNDDHINGTTGVVTGISLEDHALTVRTDEDGEITYDFDGLDELHRCY
jgi:MOSC domain-containing protein YiiM